MGDIGSEYFEDLSIMLDAQVYDPYVLFDKNEVRQDMLKLGSAKKIVCNEFETQIICHEQRNVDHLSKMEEFKCRISNKLTTGIFMSKFHQVYFNCRATKQTQTEDRVYKSGR